jgi:hypothetical protein
MSSLFTVTMFRQHAVYSYDDRGRRVNERIERLEVVVTDLPQRTALAYQFKFPNSGVKITQQNGAAVTLRTPSRDYYERGDEQPAPVASDDLVHVPTRTAEKDLIEAAKTGDFAAAINEAA